MKYNIIGNGCFSSFITKNLLKQKYVNPFIWSLLRYEDMYNLISLYDVLNFDSYKIIYNEKDNNYTINIDNKVNILYIHYKLDKNAKEYTVIGSDGFYCDMENYLKKKYEEHIVLMKRYDPIFLVAQTNSVNHYTEKELDSIENIKSNYIIYVDREKKGNTKASKDIYKELKNNGVLV